MEINRQGVTRIVILYKHWAIKIPNFLYQWNHFLWGLLSNMEEGLTWKIANMPDSELYQYRDLICPVVWSSWGGWISIMKRVDRILTDEEYLELDLELYNNIHSDDNKADNFGWLDGRIVKIDYAK